MLGVVLAVAVTVAVEYSKDLPFNATKTAKHLSLQALLLFLESEESSFVSHSFYSTLMQLQFLNFGATVLNRLPEQCFIEDLKNVSKSAMHSNR